MAISSTEMRELLVASMEAPRHEQHVSFGPLLDGRVIKVDIAFDAAYPTTGIIPLGDGRYLIKVDREQVAKAFVAMDAMLVCARFPLDTCPLVSDVVRAANGSSRMAEVLFLDEIHPETASFVRTSREDASIHMSSLSAGIEDLMLVVDLHEIGHAVLGHLTRPLDPQISAQLEAEADGFALAVLALADMPAVGAVAPLIDVMFSEEGLGEAAFTHPPAACRIAAFSHASMRWVKDNAGAISAPSTDDEMDEFAEELLAVLDTLDDPIVAALAQGSDCSFYLANFAVGLKEAARLVDQNTTLDVSGPAP